jgi:DNA-directed RNA polymerase specialized sigma24 family protein
MGRSFGLFEKLENENRGATPQTIRKLMKMYPKIDRAAHLKDLEICTQYLVGNYEPFHLLLQTSYAKLIKYIHYNCRNKLNIHINAQDKEDLISETVEAAIRDLNTFHGWSLFSTWMIAIGRNRIYALLRRRRKEENSLTEDASDVEKSQNSSSAVWKSFHAFPNQTRLLYA